eukprot:2161066-Rhodomonas_salina.1
MQFSRMQLEFMHEISLLETEENEVLEKLQRKAEIIRNIFCHTLKEYLVPNIMDTTISIPRMDASKRC